MSDMEFAFAVLIGVLIGALFALFDILTKER